MSFIGKFLGNIFGTSIAEPVTAVKDLIKSLYLTDAKKTEYRNTLDQLQAQVCKIEAANPNKFVSGARAALIWICAICLAFYWIPQYGIGSFFWVKGCILHHALISFPLNVDKLFEMITSLLGLGVIHKFTK